MWDQIYSPLGNTALSTIAAAVPVVTLLVLIASGKVKAHLATVTDMIPARPTLAGVSSWCRTYEIGQPACTNFSGSFDLNQRDLPCVIIFCGVPGG